MDIHFKKNVLFSQTIQTVTNINRCVLPIVEVIIDEVLAFYVKNKKSKLFNPNHNNTNESSNFEIVFVISTTNNVTDLKVFTHSRAATAVALRI